MGAHRFGMSCHLTLLPMSRQLDQKCRRLKLPNPGSESLLKIHTRAQISSFDIPSYQVVEVNGSGRPVVGLIPVLLPGHELEAEPPVAGVDDLGNLQLERPRLVLREDADVELPPQEDELLH